MNKFEKCFAHDDSFVRDGHCVCGGRFVNRDMPLCSSATHDELCVWIESESLLSKYLGHVRAARRGHDVVGRVRVLARVGGWSDAGPPSRGGRTGDGYLKHQVHASTWANGPGSGLAGDISHYRINRHRVNRWAPVRYVRLAT